MTTKLEAAAIKLGEIVEEQERRETSLHFVMLGTLRYNREEIFELLERKGVIPLEQLKKLSGFYQFILEEGRQEGRRQAITEFFRQLVAKRFPSLHLGAEVEAVEHPELLEQLACELNEIPDAQALQRKLNELTLKQD